MIRFLKYLTASVIILNFAWFILPHADDGSGERPTTYVECPEGYAIRIPAGEVHNGALLDCEDYDIYYATMRQEVHNGGHFERAAKYLLTPPRSQYDKRVNKER